MSSFSFSSSSKSSSTTTTEEEQQPTAIRFVDIGANLLDERYTDGIYYGKQRHEPDFDLVLERALRQGVTHVILTAGTLEESRKALDVVKSYRARWREESRSDGDGDGGGPPLFLGCTVGVHPTRCKQEFVDKPAATATATAEDDEEKTLGSADAVLDALTDLLERGHDDGAVVAIGEFGLDYDRLEFSPKDVQIEFFRRQLDRYRHRHRSAKDLGTLPLFLHNRSVGRDLLEILLEHKDEVHPETGETVPLRGVVHSFDDTLELAREFIDLGLYIGLNGCSLKTEDNLSVVRDLPLDRILLETDCPYCEIKATHAGHGYVRTTFPKKAEKKHEVGKLVKGRNEPCQIVQVAEVIAGVKDIPVEEVARACYRNSMDLYGGSFGSSGTTTPS